MSKDRSGYIYQHPKTGAWTARIPFTDSHGKRQDIRRTAENKTAAKTLLKDLINKIEDKGEVAIAAEKIRWRFCSGLVVWSVVIFSASLG